MRFLKALFRSRESSELPGATRYYGGWSGYSLPKKPTDLIDEANAAERRTYYVGRFGSDGRLAHFEKYLDGKLDWADTYEYWGSGALRRAVSHRSDGSIVVNDFDERGRPIEA